MVIKILLLLSTISNQMNPLEERVDLRFSFSESNLLFHGKAIEWDCYFTMEENTYEDSKRRLNYELCYRDFSLSSSDISLDQFIKELNKQFPNYLAFRDSTNNAVVRIVNKTFLDNPNYVMKRKVSLLFFGCPTELLISLNKIDSKINWPMAGTFGTGQINGDGRTQIKFKAKEKEIRSVLTDYLPLSRYRRWLWVAMTPADLSSTWVRYKGKAPLYFFRKEIQEKKLIEFSKGEKAYYVNQDLPGANAAAKEFIKEEMQKPKPHQVRWAMFFLGQRKAETAIPLLIKHIDYLYSMTGLLEETYPAVKALSLLGKPTTRPLFEAIEKENSNLRIRLMCKVIANVEGFEEAHTMLERRHAFTLDQEKMDRLKKARSLMGGEGF